MITILTLNQPVISCVLIVMCIIGLFPMALPSQKLYCVFVLICTFQMILLIVVPGLSNNSVKLKMTDMKLGLSSEEKTRITEKLNEGTKVVCENTNKNQIIFKKINCKSIGYYNIIKYKVTVKPKCESTNAKEISDNLHEADENTLQNLIDKIHEFYGID